VFEFAEEGTTPYIVMEFLRGMSLAARLDAPPPLTLDDTLDIVAQLCAGLSYAHEQGVVHRDVKPANIFLLTDTTVKLLDFGIAKVTTSNLTRQGDVLGSASYMSPEQVMGSDAVDGRADIFSTGVVLYELLCGRRPFEGDAPTAIVMRILNEEPPPIDVVAPGLPAELVAIVGRALQKDAANRYATAADMGRELQMVRRALQSGDLKALGRSTAVTQVIPQKTAAGKAAPPPGAPRRGWMVPAGIVAALVIVAAIAATVLRGGPPAPAPTAVTAAPAAGPGKSSPPTPAAETPAATETSLQVTSDPAGAAISLDGRDTKQVTPASVLIGGAGPHRMRLSKRGYQSFDARLADADLKKGAVSYTLPPAEAAAPAPPPVATAAAITLSATGPYPFEIYDGTKVVSAASQSHELKMPVGRKLRLVAAAYSLNQPVTVEAAADRRMAIQAPGLGKLTIRTTLETCRFKIGDRDLGNVPINNVPIAAGQYTIDLVSCRDGIDRHSTVLIAVGQSLVARIP
jgi:serine/threonine-protein kinase